MKYVQERSRDRKIEREEKRDSVRGREIVKEKRSESEREEEIDRFEDEIVREGNIYTDRQ